MNIFKEYGIKEVADVTFYSITRIGQEEFYIPVLYFDTLKTTSFDKSLNTVTASGGKGNSKLLAWNFEKEIKMKLSDALFSHQSLNVFMNGKVMAKMSDWTSAIAKLNVANKYGQKNYSIKAYPSPELTQSEEEIIFRCAQKSGYDPRQGSFSTVGERDGGYKHDCKYLYDTAGQDEDIDSIVAENRYRIIDQYYNRTQPTPKSRDISEFIEYDKSNYDGLNVVLEDIDLQDEFILAKELFQSEIGKQKQISRNVKITFNNKNKTYSLSKHTVTFDAILEKYPEGWRAIQASITSNDDIKSIFLGYNKNIISNQIYIGDDFFLRHILYYLFPNYLEDAIGDLCQCDLRNQFYKAMPKKVIDYISQELTEFTKIGRFQNDMYETQVIDRMEKCVVSELNGFKIDLVQQMDNVKKLYRNDKDCFTVFYDVKTMQPFMGKKELDEQVYKQKCVEVKIKTSDEILRSIKAYLRQQYSLRCVDSLTKDDYTVNKIIDLKDSFLIYFTITKKDYIYLKYGTVYYKWTRTIDIDNTAETFIGTDISIGADNFSGEYMIVGESLIREQQTGKDQRVQIVLPRTNISSSTSLKLDASGNPTTFSIDVNVLLPIDKNKSMIELRLFNVEEDKIEGGYRVVPQNKNYSKTPTMEIFEEIVPQNNEIY